MPSVIVNGEQRRVPASVATQADLPSLNGAGRTWFCGAYFGYGFHEDGLRSALAVADDFGVGLS